MFSCCVNSCGSVLMKNSYLYYACSLAGKSEEGTFVMKRRFLHSVSIIRLSSKKISVYIFYDGRKTLLRIISIIYSQFICISFHIRCRSAVENLQFNIFMDKLGALTLLLDANA